MKTKRSSRSVHTIGGKHGAKCAELLALLNDYVDGKVSPAVCKDLQAHLAKCNPCQVVVDNVRQTITLYRDTESCELPLAFRSRLHSALRKCWNQRGSTSRGPRAKS